MNNNRGNNRRRGRGNNRSQGGSGNQLNRIDSRARGNAPQLLEKYRKLAQDAQLNGDRVQAEYYFQFADHYFRVIADSQAQREEFRPRREGPREQEGYDEDGDFDRGQRRIDDRYEQREEVGEASETESAPNSFEPPENPFVRDNRPHRNRSRDDRPQRRPRGEERDAEIEEQHGRSESLDIAVLPPAINQSGDPAEVPVAEEAPKPRRRTRRSKADGDEALESVS